MQKKRLDLILVDRKLFPSRERAQAAIMAGVVRVNGQREEKAGTGFAEDVTIEITEDPLKYVSRGGLKLEKALALWQISLTHRVAMDIGASTGGFTDVMLQNGAKKVYCVDVGYGQLDWKLRQDPRVINMERTNIRYLDPTGFPAPLDFITIDVSFISLRLVLPVAAALLKPGGLVIALIKPQFEARREQVGKKGIIRDPKIHEEVQEKVRGYGQENHLTPTDVTPSPIRGTKGNVEFLMRLVKEQVHGL